MPEDSQRAYVETNILKNDFLEEIWGVREKKAARYDYGLRRMVFHLQETQVKHGTSLHAEASGGGERLRNHA
jgi:hypothetical protein